MTNRTAILEQKQAYCRSGVCVDCGSVCDFRGDCCRGCSQKRAGVGADHFNWKGDEIGYEAAHKRVHKTRGLASDYLCIDCSSAAKDWSYDHSDPDEKRQLNSYGYTLPYSCNPEHYEPRCRACHNALDHNKESL